MEREKDSRMVLKRGHRAKATETGGREKGGREN